MSFSCTRCVFFSRCVLSVFLLLFLVINMESCFSYFVSFIVSLGLWEVPSHVRYDFHDIVFSSFPYLSENDIKVISIELLKVIPDDVEPDVHFYAHIVTDEEMASQTLDRLFSLFRLIIADFYCFFHFPCYASCLLFPDLYLCLYISSLSTSLEK